MLNEMLHLAITQAIDASSNSIRLVYISTILCLIDFMPEMPNRRLWINGAYGIEFYTALIKGSFISLTELAYLPLGL